MKKFSIKDLSKIIKANESQATSRERRFFTGVSTDSRTTRPGDCFFAITGDNFDGHDYLQDAFAKGAVCAVVRGDKAEKFTGKTVFKVGDTVKALGDFARQYRRRSAFKVVAVTGSVGKTTTRQVIHHVLSRRFRCYQSPKNFNNNIGLPLTLLGADPDDQIIVAELASNHPGEIAYLTQIAQPDIAVITNVHPAHLAGFGNLQTVVQEKLSISDGLSPNGLLIINADFDLLVNACRAKGLRFTTFGKSGSADIRAVDISYTGFASRFTVGGAEVFLPLPGPGNVENALAAWVVCSQLGVSSDDFVDSVKTLSAVSMRAEPLQIGTLMVLNDCYNANPASMKNALDILADLASAAKRRPVFICGDMAELGQQTQPLHDRLGTHIAQARVQLLLAVGGLAKIAAESAKKAAKYNLQTECFSDTLSVCNNLEKFIKDTDIILVKGSRVAGLESAVRKLKEIFSPETSGEAQNKIQDDR